MKKCIKPKSGRKKWKRFIWSLPERNRSLSLILLVTNKLKKKNLSRVFDYYVLWASRNKQWIVESFWTDGSRFQDSSTFCESFSSTSLRSYFSNNAGINNWSPGVIAVNNDVYLECINGPRTRRNYIVLPAADLDSAFVKLTIYLNLGIARLYGGPNARRD